MPYSSLPSWARSTIKAGAVVTALSAAMAAGDAGLNYFERNRQEHCLTYDGPAEGQNALRFTDGRTGAIRYILIDGPVNELEIVPELSDSPEFVPGQTYNTDAINHRHGGRTWVRECTPA